MALTIDEHIDELGKNIQFALCHYQVWQTFREAEANATDVATMNRYLDFVVSTKSAHFLGMIACCFHINERKKNTVNFRRLKKLLMVHEKLDIDKDFDVVKLQTDIEPIWKKIEKLRHNSIAHFTEGANQAAVFAMAQLSQEDVENYLANAVELHRKITYRRNQSIEAFQIDAGTPARRWLDDLAR